MTDLITLTGFVATEPRHLKTSTDLDVTSFRLASTQRKFDRTENRWVDGETNWYTVSTFRHLAVNVAECVEKGQRVMVSGRLRVRDWTNGEKGGTSVEIDADAVGHDLAWGTATYTRSSGSSSGSTGPAPAEGAEPASAESGEPASGAEAKEPEQVPF